MSEATVSEVELIKEASNYLRGTILEGLADPITGAIDPSDCQLTKFHGIYQQDDRDIRNERRRQKLEPYYMFMIRVRLPSGICTADQYLAMDALADSHGNSTLKLTTRQAYQLHGIIKRNLKPAMQGINAALMTTIAACGDVCRNVMATSDPLFADFYDELHAASLSVSDLLTPRTSAYYELWLDGEKAHDSREPDVEPIYGKTYLPRKFKVGIAMPPSNDVDVFSQDLGYIAILEDGKIVGYNVTVGGGMGMTFGMNETYPRLADVIGFCTTEQVPIVAEHVVKIQRDHGDRANRKHARFKYTIDDRGIDWFKTELNSRMGFDLEPARPYEFTHNIDGQGWVQSDDGMWHFTIFVENGRVEDRDGFPLKAGLREIAKAHDGVFRLTPNQHLVINDVSEENKPVIQALMDEYGISDQQTPSGLRRGAMACVGLGSCALANAESERYLPSLVTRLEPLLAAYGLTDDEIVMRMTGCPNGCGRPYLGEIGFVGKSLGRYNLYLGAGYVGDRLNKLHSENVNEDEIVEILDPMFAAYASERESGERFGSFVIRKGYVKATVEGKDFHA
jgi:sulfite reductase (NADPH) hemoprotein beta-component